MISISTILSLNVYICFIRSFLVYKWIEKIVDFILKFFFCMMYVYNSIVDSRFRLIANIS